MLTAHAVVIVMRFMHTLYMSGGTRSRYRYVNGYAQRTKYDIILFLLFLCGININELLCVESERDIIIS